MLQQFSRKEITAMEELPGLEMATVVLEVAHTVVASEDIKASGDTAMELSVEGTQGETIKTSMP